MKEINTKSEIKVYSDQGEANAAAVLYKMWSRSEDHGEDFIKQVKPNLMSSTEVVNYWRLNKKNIGMCIGGQSKSGLNVWCYYRKIT